MSQSHSSFSNLTFHVFSFWLIFFFPIEVFFPDLSFAESSLTKQISVQYLIHMGDSYFHNRGIPGNVEQAHQHYLRALKLSPKNAELHWKVTRNFWELGDWEENIDKKLAYYQQGIQYGEKAIQIGKLIPESHFWYATSVGSFMIHKGIIQTLYYRDLVKSELEEALRLSPNDYLALIGLAHWYFKIPKLMGGSKEKAYQLLNQAQQIQPNFARTYLSRAQFLIEEGKREKAISALHQILELKNPDDLSAHIRAQMWAKEYLEATK